MKKVTKFFMAALLAGICSFGYAQDYRNPPKANEKVIGLISTYESCDIQYFNGKITPPHPTYMTEKEAYNLLLNAAKEKYKKNYLDLRELVGSIQNVDLIRWGGWEAVVVDKNCLSKALDKALLDVREGSCLALDIIKSTGDIDQDELKDQVVDLLLTKGYKVVAKDYLEKLYEEQKSQQSGIYNERTTVKANNFSAVGYYINVKQTEAVIKVQVINVSTGECESNITVNL